MHALARKLSITSLRRTATGTSHRINTALQRTNEPYGLTANKPFKKLTTDEENNGRSQQKKKKREENKCHVCSWFVDSSNDAVFIFFVLGICSGSLWKREGWDPSPCDRSHELNGRLPRGNQSAGVREPGSSRLHPLMGQGSRR